MHPFEATIEEIQAQPDQFVSTVFSSLVSEFLVMPKGEGFTDYPTFESGYEHLKRVTEGFQYIEVGRVLPVTVEHPITLVVLRAMLGFTPPEWAYITTRQTGISGAARIRPRS